MFKKMIFVIGVIMLMFSAGLGTNLKELLKVGHIAFLVAVAGVFVPLAGGVGVYYLFGFNNGARFFEALVMGTILAATSERYSAKVSKLETSTAKSSSSSGSSSNTMELSLTLNTATLPASSAAWYSVGKVTLTSNSSPAL